MSAIVSILYYMHLCKLPQIFWGNKVKISINWNIQQKMQVGLKKGWEIDRDREEREEIRQKERKEMWAGSFLG